MPLHTWLTDYKLRTGMESKSSLTPEETFKSEIMEQNKSLSQSELDEVLEEIRMV